MESSSHFLSGRTRSKSIESMACRRSETKIKTPRFEIWSNGGSDGQDGQVAHRGASPKLICHLPFQPVVSTRTAPSPPYPLPAPVPLLPFAVFALGGFLVGVSSLFLVGPLHSIPEACGPGSPCICRPRRVLELGLQHFLLARGRCRRPRLR